MTPKAPAPRNAWHRTRTDSIHDSPAPTQLRIVRGQAGHWHRHLISVQSPTDSELSQRRLATTTPTARPGTCWALNLDAVSVPSIKHQPQRPVHRWGSRGEARCTSRATVANMDRPLDRCRISQRQIPIRSPSCSAGHSCKTVLGPIVRELSERLSQRLVVTWKSLSQHVRFRGLGGVDKYRIPISAVFLRLCICPSIGLVPLDQPRGAKLCPPSLRHKYHSSGRDQTRYAVNYSNI